MAIDPLIPLNNEGKNRPSISLSIPDCIARVQDRFVINL